MSAALEFASGVEADGDRGFLARRPGHRSLGEANARDPSVQTNKCAKTKAVTVAIGIGTERGLAIASDGGEHAAFGGDASGGIAIVNRGENSAHGGIGGSALDAEGTLSGSREADLWGQDLRGSPLEPQTNEARAGQDDGVALSGVDLAKAGVDIAAKRDERQIGPQTLERELAAKARSSEASGGGKRLQ